MVRRTKVYHILPELVYQGDIEIGAVLQSLEDLVVVNEDAGKALEISADRFHKSSKKNVAISGKAALACHSSFLGGVATVALEAGFGIGTAAGDMYYVEELGREEVMLKKSDYLRAVATSVDVQTCLGSLGAKLYMVTGILTCRKKSVRVFDKNEASLHLKVKTDVGQATLGLEQLLSWERDEEQEMIEEAPCIFAVRVVKLTYKRKFLLFGESVLQNTKHVKGAELIHDAESQDVGAEEEFDVEEEEDFAEGYDESAVVADKMSELADVWVLH